MIQYYNFGKAEKLVGDNAADYAKKNHNTIWDTYEGVVKTVKGMGKKDPGYKDFKKARDGMASHIMEMVPTTKTKNGAGGIIPGAFKFGSLAAAVGGGGTVLKTALENKFKYGIPISQTLKDKELYKKAASNAVKLGGFGALAGGAVNPFLTNKKG